MRTHNSDNNTLDRPIENQRPNDRAIPWSGQNDSLHDISDLNTRFAIGCVLPIVLMALGALRVLNMGLVIGIIGWMGAAYVFYYIRKKPDEKTKRLDAYARNLSWVSTVFFLSVWYWIDLLKIVTLSSDQLIMGILLFLVYSYWMTHFIISGKSEEALTKGRGSFCFFRFF